jgi:hypothetical protein
LAGYQYGTTGYVGTGSDVINAVFSLNSSYTDPSAGLNVYGNFLLDGPSDGSSYFNFIQFTCDYSNAPALVFADPSFGLSGTGTTLIPKTLRKTLLWAEALGRLPQFRS